jgi:hypothetical protein
MRAIKHIQRIRKVVDDAIARNWLDRDPFYNYKGKQEKTNRTYLTQEELNLIQSTEMPFKRLEKVKDIFIFACYTGLIALQRYVPISMNCAVSKNNK